MLQYCSSTTGGTKNGSMMGASSIGVLDNPYQNPAAAAALLAMHQSSSAQQNHIPHYNYLHSQGQLNHSAVPLSAGQATGLPPQGRSAMGPTFYNHSLSPTHSLTRMPTPQDYVTAAAKRLNDQICASRNLTDDHLKG